MDISASLDGVGGEFNAFTAKEYTCFHARVQSLIGTPIDIVSTGPDREHTIVLRHPYRG